jgi:hypothetical protein
VNVLVRSRILHATQTLGAPAQIAPAYLFLTDPILGKPMRMKPSFAISHRAVTIQSATILA